jgi:uncharacterized membrane protein
VTLRRVVLMGVLASTIVFAQRGGGSRNGGGMQMPEIGFGPVNKLDRISEVLSLNKDQKKDLKQTFDDAQKEAASLHEPMSKARQAIAEAVASGKGREEIAKLSASEAEIEAQMTAIELKAFAKVAMGLDADQRQRAAALYGMMRGLFSGKNWNSD